MLRWHTRRHNMAGEGERDSTLLDGVDTAASRELQVEAEMCICFSTACRLVLARAACCCTTPPRSEVPIGPQRCVGARGWAQQKDGGVVQAACVVAIDGLRADGRRLFAGATKLRVNGNGEQREDGREFMGDIVPRALGVFGGSADSAAGTMALSSDVYHEQTVRTVAALAVAASAGDRAAARGLQLVL